MQAFQFNPFLVLPMPVFVTPKTFDHPSDLDPLERLKRPGVKGKVRHMIQRTVKHVKDKLIEAYAAGGHSKEEVRQQWAIINADLDGKSLR